MDNADLVAQVADLEPTLLDKFLKGENPLDETHKHQILDRLVQSMKAGMDAVVNVYATADAAAQTGGAKGSGI